MIRLACTNCKNVLTIDDAFAGGVCRCQHCGTIQTVPARGADATATGDLLIGQTVGGGGGGAGGAARSTYQQAGRGDAAGTGLDDLANIVVSSGLSSGRLTRAAPAKPNLIPWFAAAGIVLLALVGVIAYLLTHSAGSPTPANPAVTGNPGQTAPRPGPGVGRPAGTEPPAGPATPAFCGVPLTGSVVVYLLDRGDATQEMLPALKDATLNSALSLGADRKFQVVFWAAGGADVTSFPESGTAYGSRESVADGKRAIEDVTAFGQTDVKPALAAALADGADEIVLATGKGWQLKDEWVRDALAARGSSTVRIDTFNLNGSGESTALRDLSAKTGGTYHDLTNGELDQFAH